MFCYTNQFPSMPFFSLHEKPHGVCVFRKHHHMLLDPKLGHGTFIIRQIPCVCYVCTSILDKTWYPGVAILWYHIKYSKRKIPLRKY